jgi:hypothetical protein
VPRSRLAILTLISCLAVAGTARAATLRVCASGCTYTGLQQAIDAAQPGDTILLRAGETFVGHVTLKKKSGTTDILIRSDAADSELPPAGTRLVPSTRGGTVALSKLARLKGRGGTYKSTPLIVTEAGAHNYRLQFLDIDGVAQEGYETLVALGNNTTQTSTSLAPSKITFDRVYIHGDAVRGQKRCLALNSASTSILNSYFADCKHFASDSQAIAVFNGPGPFTIENNYLEGSTENILFGGSDPKTPNLVPSDIIIRRNYITKKVAWRNPILGAPGSPKAVSSSASGALGAGTHYFKVQAVLASGGSSAFSPASAETSVTISSSTRAVTVSWSAVSGATSYRIYRGTSSGGESRWLETPTASTTFVYTGNSEQSATPKSATYWNVKNLIELKNAQRVTIEGNIVEYAWQAAQTGFAFLLTPKNQENTAPWTVVQDVTIRYNKVRHVNGCVNILGRDYQSSTGSQQAKRITIANNVFEDVGGSWGSSGQFILMSRSPATITVDHNTVFHTGHVVFVDNGTVSGFVYRNNMSRHNTYGIAGSGASFGSKAIAAYFPSGVVTKNVLAGGSASLYPSGNFFPTVSAWLGQFVNQSAGDYRLASTSPYRNAGTDGRDLGADLTALAAAQQGSGAPSSPSTNGAPIAKPGGPYTATAGVAVSVSGSGSSDPDGTIASYKWSWGDGSSAGSGVTASHTYASAGSYTLTLTVTDNSGTSASASTTVTVQSTTTATDIVLTAADVTTVKGGWAKVSSSGSPGSQALASTEAAWWTSVPLARPANYFEAAFTPSRNTAYRVWLRLSARSAADDSVFVQFTGAVDGAGTPLWRTGSTQALLVNLEDCGTCGVSGWGWQDGAHWITTPSIVRFPSVAPQAIRVQTREDGVKVDQIVLSPVNYMSHAPGSVTNDGTLLPRTAATLTARDVVLRAVDAATLVGNWKIESDTSAADGRRLGSAVLGVSNSSALASPPSYVDLTFAAVAGVPYRAWFRMSATANSWASDSMFVQYSGSLVGGQPLWRIGTTSALVVTLEACEGCGLSGWGWRDSSWWLGTAGTITFATTGVQTIRVQTRQDGLRIDQIVLSPSQYMSKAPGATKNDTTIVPR